MLTILLMNIGAAFLGCKGVISPYIGAMMALTLGLTLGLNSVSLIFAVVSVYLSIFFANTVNQVSGLSSDNSMLLDQSNLSCYVGGGTLSLIKLVGLMLPLTIYIPKFEWVLPGWMIFAGAICFIWWSYPRSYHEEDHTLLSYFYLFSTFAQCGILTITLLLFNHFTGGIGINVIPAMIAGVSVWSILLGDKSTENEYNENADVDTPPILAWIATPFITVLTPGLTNSVMAGVFTSPGKGRTIFTVAMEAIIEGWVLSQFIHGAQSGKTMLGDLLQSNPINLSSFSSLPSDSLIDLLYAAPFFSFFCFFISLLLPSIPIDSKTCIILTTLANAFMMCGPFAFLFLIAGFLTYTLRLALPPLPDTRPLMFIIPTVIS